MEQLKSNWSRAEVLTGDDGDQAAAIDAGSDLLGRGGAGEARGPFAVEPPHQAADSDGTLHYGTSGYYMPM